MKNITSLLILAAAAFIIAGCSTVDSRIKDKQSVFNSLNSLDQANIKQGIVFVGYTEDMVYMAMGKPDKVRERATPTGTSTTWIYNEYYQDYVGRERVGYRRNVYYDSYAKVWRVYYTPVSEAVYQNRVEEIARVLFTNGKVESIERSDQ